MVSAILILICLILFVLALHVYLNYFRPPERRHHRVSFTTEGGQDPFLGVATGLDKSFINSLPTFAFSKKEKSGDEKDSSLECAVCLCEFQQNEKCRLLPNCKHTFHTDCIDMWFFSQSTCPLCRAMVVSPTLAPPSPPPPPPPQQQQEQLHIEVDATQTQIATFLNDLSFTLHSPQEYSSTRSLPHLAIDIPRRRWDSNFTSPRCLSLSLPRCSSPLEQGCSSSPPPTLNSPSAGIGMSFKRLLSKEKRVLPSDKETSETDHYGAGSSV